MWSFKVASTTRQRNTKDPSIDITMEAAAYWQYFLNILQTLFHCVCEFPCTAITPTAAAAPLAEKSSAAIIRSDISSGNAAMSLVLLDSMQSTRDTTEYVHAMAFATTKKLQ